MTISKLMTFDNSMVFIEKLVKIWVDYHASDIHITPSKEQVYIRYRISWNLESFYWISLENYDKLLNSIKVASFMAIDEHNHIQDWKIIFSIKNNLEDLIVKSVWLRWLNFPI